MIGEIAATIVLPVLLIIYRIWACLPRRQKNKDNVHCNNNKKVRTIVVFGSGGHTTEALKLLESFGGDSYDPICFVLSIVSE